MPVARGKTTVQADRRPQPRRGIFSKSSPSQPKKRRTPVAKTKQSKRKFSAEKLVLRVGKAAGAPLTYLFILSSPE